MPKDHTGLLTGSNWGGIEVMDRPVFVTYSFPIAANSYVASISDPNLNAGALATWAAFSVAEAALARTALAEWADASGLTLIEVAAGQGDINFQKLDFSGTGYDGAGGIAYRPFGDWSFASYPYFTSDLDAAGDVIMNRDIPVDYGTLLHEIGHALGLKHPTEAWTQFAAIPPVEHAVWDVDDPALTIMSELPGGGSTLTPIDIAAIQAIYGTNSEDGTQIQSWSFSASLQRLTQTGFATDDVIRGVSVADVMNGGDGNDRLYGLAGVDTLNGGTGNDTLDGGAGKDKLVGGADNDTYYVTTGDKITESVGGGFDTVYATGNYTLSANIEVLTILGSAKATANGNGQANEIYGGSGASKLNGKGGADYIVGGSGKDTITGGLDGDVMFGGGGADQFVFASFADFGPGDTVGDFAQAQGDKIGFKGIDPDSGTAGDQAFSFVGTAAFTVDTRFQVRYEVTGGNTVVEIDADRDGDADHSILLYGAITLTAGDFLL